MVSEELKALVKQRVEQCSEATGISFKVGIRYDLNSSAMAGQAIMSPGAYMIRLNPHLLNEHKQSFIDDVVGHEWAHVAVWDRQQATGHGKAWQMMMRKVGQEPNRTHNFKAPAGVQMSKYGSREEATCMKCDEPVSVGPRQATNIKKGVKYTHNKCGGQVMTNETKNTTTHSVNPAKTKADKPSGFRAGSKMAICEEIYLDDANFHLSRQELLTKFVAAADVTQNYASTIYQTLKTRHHA